MRRVIDIIFSLVILFIFFIPILFISLLIKLTSKGPILYWSSRVGFKNKIFLMPKFRTMHIQTPEIATNDLLNPDIYITKLGSFLRRYSLDEIPQLWCLLSGNMTLIGPSPALFNQHDLIKLRTDSEIHILIPGITGYAQINGRDSLNLEDKVNLEVFYKKNRSFFLDLKIIFLTIIKVFMKEGVSH